MAIYRNFQRLSLAVYPLSHPRFYRNYLEGFRVELINFLKEFEVIYGREHLVYNIHCLQHLADDVNQMGPLESFSAFPFESYMQTIRRSIHSNNAITKQAANRFAEKVFHDYKSGGVHNEIINDCEVDARRQTVNTRNTLITSSSPDNLVIAHGRPGLITQINREGLTFRPYAEFSDFFEEPFKSSHIGIWKCPKVSPYKPEIRPSDITCKCFGIRTERVDTKSSSYAYNSMELEAVEAQKVCLPSKYPTTNFMETVMSPIARKENYDSNNKLVIELQSLKGELHSFKQEMKAELQSLKTLMAQLLSVTVIVSKFVSAIMSDDDVKKILKKTLKAYFHGIRDRIDKRESRRRLDIPLYCLWLVVTLLLCNLNSVCKAEIDNEFAEFEDPDDSFTIDISEPVPVQSIRQQKSENVDKNISDSNAYDDSGVNQDNSAMHANLKPDDDEEFEGLSPHQPVSSNGDKANKGGKRNLIIAKVSSFVRLFFLFYSYP
ncbi:unnamed protein product [Trichobilharzia regenti]|nr:unnamed protein product [Trichobilharzia regenti]